MAVMTSNVDFVTQTLEVFTLSPFAITKSIPLTGQPYINNAASLSGVVYLGTSTSQVLTVDLDTEVVTLLKALSFEFLNVLAGGGSTLAALASTFGTEAGNLVTLDATTGVIKATAVGTDFLDIAVTPDGTRVVGISQGRKALVIMDVATLTENIVVSLASTPLGVAARDDVAVVTAFPLISGGEAVLVDLETGEILDRLPIDGLEPTASQNSGGGQVSIGGDIAVVTLQLQDITTFEVVRAELAIIRLE